MIHHLEHTPGFVRSLERLEAVVLDEVDLLLELGFMPQVRAIYTRSTCSLPRLASCRKWLASHERHPLLFSVPLVPEVSFILRFCPDGHRSILCSATATAEARRTSDWDNFL